MAAKSSGNGLRVVLKSAASFENPEAGATICSLANGERVCITRCDAGGGSHKNESIKSAGPPRYSERVLRIRPTTSRQRSPLPIVLRQSRLLLLPIRISQLHPHQLMLKPRQSKNAPSVVSPPPPLVPAASHSNPPSPSTVSASPRAPSPVLPTPTTLPETRSTGRCRTCARRNRSRAARSGCGVRCWRFAGKEREGRGGEEEIDIRRGVGGLAAVVLGEMIV